MGVDSFEVAQLNTVILQATTSSATESELSAGPYSKDRLNQSTKSALHAAMKIETTVMDLSSGYLDTRDMQTRMFRELSSLKESLWQVLVISNELPHFW